MKKTNPTASPLLSAVTVKVEKEAPSNHASALSPSVPAKMGNGSGPVTPQTYSPSLGSPISEQKPISLSKLMQARAQRNQQDFYQATGIFSFEVHRQPNHSDTKMPESPVDQSNGGAKSSASTTLAGTLVPHPTSRTSSSSTGSLMNGVHSPHSINGTPSPPATVSGGTTLTTTTSSQDLPPACGARQLSKLKRFLTTLQQFGTDISPEIGERVRSLVMGLVNNALTVEEFHNKLQEATNFPLRPFVIPFLKANLPLLQRELMHCARLAKVNPQQYYMQHEQQILEVKNTTEPSDGDINENGKRRSPDDRMSSRSKENGSSSSIEVPLPKRHRGSPTTPGGGMPSSANSFSHLPAHPFRVEDMVPHLGAREPREFREMRENLDRERERHPSFGFPPSRESLFPDPFYFDDRIEDEWKHVETMLQCIVGMVEKTKRALAVLHQRSVQDREELALWARRQSVDRNFNKRPSGEAAVSPVDDRVTEVKRRAEEAVNEVKRQAVSELQKAVAAAEQKANEMVTAERAKLDQSILDARQKAAEEALTLLNQQEDSSENCWNCGRKANETCSGCNTARYCGSFCQHKDWENHHRMCSQYVNQQSKPGSSSKTAIPETMSSLSKDTPTPPAVALMRASPPTASPTGSHRSTNSPRTSSSTPPSRLPIPVEGAR